MEWAQLNIWLSLMEYTKRKPAIIQFDVLMTKTDTIDILLGPLLLNEVFAPFFFILTNTDDIDVIGSDIYLMIKNIKMYRNLL